MNESYWVIAAFAIKEQNPDASLIKPERINNAL
jgi:hypothetical protein